jgi:hypothetical protein
MLDTENNSPEGYTRVCRLGMLTPFPAEIFPPGLTFPGPITPDPLTLDPKTL